MKVSLLLLVLPLHMYVYSNCNGQERSVYEREAAIEWMKEVAIPLDGVDAEQGFHDMEPLRDVIGDARIVSLGEATHGTREFFQMKHRMLEFLVTEMGFNIFAIEATMPEGFDVNEYVLTGKGDPEKALAGLYFWTWNTQEVLEMIRWMRRYNADGRNTRKVKFYGNDIQSPVRPMKVVLAYLDQVGSEKSEQLRAHEALSLLVDAYSAQSYARVDEALMLDALDVMRETTKELDAKKTDYLSNTSEEEWTFARLHADILERNIRMNIRSERFTNGGAIRDTAMADNVQWILEHEGPDAKMVLWAHNAHVAVHEKWMGHHLRAAYGEDMVVFGFAFNQGSFQAMEMPFWTGKGLRPFHVKPLDEKSLDATLAEVGIPISVIDLRQLPDSGAVTNWFERAPRSRSFGAGFHDSMEKVAHSQSVTSWYDALIFIDETTAARPNPGGTRSVSRMHSELVNPGFEESDAGIAPEGWNASTYWLAMFGFDVNTRSVNPFEGSHSVEITRKPGRHYGENYGSVSQRIEAEPYRGQTIRLKAAVRAEVEGVGNQAYLSLTASSSGFGPNAQVFSDRMLDRPITSKEWKVYEIEGHIPDNAERITIGMALTGEGSAWFDAVSLEIVDP